MMIVYDDINKIISFDGVKFAVELFTTFGFAPVGTIIEVVKREDGVVTVKIHECKGAKS